MHLLPININSSTKSKFISILFETFASEEFKIASKHGNLLTIVLPLIFV